MQPAIKLDFNKKVVNSNKYKRRKIGDIQTNDLRSNVNNINATLTKRNENFKDYFDNCTFNNCVFNITPCKCDVNNNKEN